MMRDLTPSFFYGAATTALCGLALGMVLHGPWQTAASGPQILFSSAAAAELAKPADDSVPAIDPVQAEADSIYDDSTPLKDEYVDPAPLPVTRLAPEPAVQDAGLDERRADTSVAADQSGDVSVATDAPSN